jgi:hypothetical protein
MATYWQRVCDFRYDPFMTEAETGKPFGPDPWPWLLPTTRVWLLAFWAALRNQDLYAD